MTINFVDINKRWHPFLLHLSPHRPLVPCTGCLEDRSGLETKRMAGPSSAAPTSFDSYGGPTNWNDARAHAGWPCTRPEIVGQATTVGFSHRSLGLLGLLRRCRRRRCRLLLHGLHGLGRLHRLHCLGHGCERRVVSKICEVGKS